jgi:dihydrofolate synthase/folylpolyglutamate synthase
VDAIQWLYGLQQIGVKLGLDNIRALLAELDHPEERVPAVLIGGTNGKGSVSAMLDAMLLASGVRAGLYTSPHLVHPCERIRLGGDDVPTTEFVARLNHMRGTIERGLARGTLPVHPSFFEVMTATALSAFAEHGLDACVLEVGLGGRLDATNAVPAVVSVVVSVDLDHIRLLGPTLADIATEKAGIIKPGRPVVSGVVSTAARRVLQEHCRMQGATWIDVSQSARLVDVDGDRITIETPRARYSRLQLALPGRHQIDNARVAIVAFETFAEALNVAVDPRAVAEGLSTCRWPGRLQWLPGTPPLLLDGAHNPAGVDALVRYLHDRAGPAPLMLFGAMREKALDAMLPRLLPCVDAVIVTRPAVERAADPIELARQIEALGRTVEVVPDVGEALARARERAGAEQFVLVTGSLYLVGDVLARVGGVTSPGQVSL